MKRGISRLLYKNVDAVKISLIIVAILFGLLANVFVSDNQDATLSFRTGKAVENVGNKDLFNEDLYLPSNKIVKQANISSNELLIKVKKQVGIRSIKSANLDVESLNKLNIKNKVVKLERVARQGRSIKGNDDISRWYKITLDKEKSLVNVDASSPTPEESYLKKLKDDYLNDPNIEDVQFNYIYRQEAIPNDPYYSSFSSWEQLYDDLWGIKKINTERAWNITSGSESIIIANIDTGVDRSHPDIQDNMWVNIGEIPNNTIDDDGNGFIDDYNGWDFADNDNDPMDDFGHGTHTVGTIAAVGNNSIGIVGVNWHAKVMALKIFGSIGADSFSVASAHIYAADMGARVSSNSYGCYCSDSLVESAVKYAYDKGMVIVAAAGNSDVDTRQYPHYPSSYDTVISVGALDADDTKAWFSNWGRIDVVAPGVDILSLKSSIFDPLSLDPRKIVGNDYYRASGTSMATPHVAGLVALILSHKPNISNDLVTSIIQASADDLQQPEFDAYTGYGRINVYNALLKAEEVLTKPELLIRSIDVGKEEVAQNAPVFVVIEARNAGKVEARGALVELFDGDPSIDSIKLAQWTFDIEPESSKILQEDITLFGAREHSLYATIDGSNSIVELFDGNNNKIDNIIVSPFQTKESVISSAPLTQKSPSIYRDIIVWSDIREGNWDVYYYNISSMKESKLTFGVGNQENAVIHGNNIVYNNYSQPGMVFGNVYLYNLYKNNPGVVIHRNAGTSLNIYKDRIAWNERSDVGLEIHVYDLGPDGKLGTFDCDDKLRCEGEYKLGGHIGASFPSLYNNKIVYNYVKDNNFDIFLYDLGPDGAYGTNDCYNSNLTSTVTTTSISTTTVSTVISTTSTIQSTTTSTISTTTTVPLSAILPVADTWVDERTPNTFWGAYPYMQLSTKPGSRRMFYIKFSVEGLTEPIRNAILHLDVLGSNCIGNDTNKCLEIRHVIANDWTERMTWNNRTTSFGASLGAVNSITAFSEYTFDVSPIVTGNGNFSFTGISNSWVPYEDTSWGTREHTNIDIRPWLEINLVSPTAVFAGEENDLLVNSGNFDVATKPAAVAGAISLMSSPAVSSVVSCEGEFQVTTDPEDQWFGAIYGDIIVWEDKRNGNENSDIYMYDLGPDGLFGTNDCDSTRKRCEGEYPLVTKARQQIRPSIYDDKIAWYDDVVAGFVPYLYDLSLNEERQLSESYSFFVSPYTRVKIFGNKVVWDRCVDMGCIQNDIYMIGFDYFPNAPRNLRALDEDNKVRLQWDISEESDVKEYLIYRGSSLDEYEFLTRSVTNSYLDDSVSNGVNYFYRVTTVDSGNGESGFSNYAGVMVGGNVTNFTSYIATNYFDGASSFSAFSLFSSGRNYDDIVLEKRGKGIVRFNRSLRFTRDADLDTYSTITDKLVFIDSNYLQDFNKSAVITMYDVNLANPKILMNGVECPETVCQLIGYTNGNFTFRVNHFTTYQVVDLTTSTTSLTTTPTTVFTSSGSGSGGGSGSGSGGGGSRRCISNIACGQWSGCINGREKRLCNDVNNCIQDYQEIRYCGVVSGIENTVGETSILETTLSQAELEVGRFNKIYLIYAGLAVVPLLVIVYFIIFLRKRAKR